MEADVEKGSYAQAAQYLDAQLQNPLVQNDSRLKLRWLTVKGIVDLNVNTIDAEHDWTEALQVAKSLHDVTWQNRATGWLGVLSFVIGDGSNAGKKVFGALLQCALHHDIGGEDVFLTYLSDGLTQDGMASKGLTAANRALALMKSNPDAPYPYRAHIAKIGALSALARYDEARPLLNTTLETRSPRGNLGGGLGLLRLMSYLTPGRIPIGYSVTRKCAERGVEKESLRRFGWIPSSKFAIPLVALRHAGRDGSVVLMTEGLGPKRFHGRMVLLVNEHTVSAGEMITAFAAENKLATLVGTETAGRLLGGSGFKVGHGYLVILPKAASYTWQGKSYEGRGVKPDVPVVWSLEATSEGKDNQLEKAVEVVKSI